MALAEVCGLNSFVDFNVSREEDNYSRQVEKYSGNFINNVQLAVPPYINVSNLFKSAVGFLHNHSTI